MPRACGSARGLRLPQRRRQRPWPHVRQPLRRLHPPLRGPQQRLTILPGPCSFGCAKRCSSPPSPYSRRCLAPQLRSPAAASDRWDTTLVVGCSRRPNSGRKSKPTDPRFDSLFRTRQGKLSTRQSGKESFLLGETLIKFNYAEEFATLSINLPLEEASILL